MELLRGPAAQVIAANRVTGSGSGSSMSVSTEFITTFAIGERQVRIKGDVPPVVNAGDEMVVAGEQDRSGVVDALCYVNVTRGTGAAEEGPWLWRLGAIVFLIFAGLMTLLMVLFLGLSLLAGKMSSDDAVLICLFAGCALPPYFAGRWMMRRGQRVSRALKLIREASVQARSGRKVR